MSNDVFVDKKTGEKVRIINEDVNFYVLDNEVRIKKDVFLKKFEESSEIDPNEFFKPAVSNDPLINLAQQLKSLDTSKLNDSSSPTQVKYTPPVVLADSSLPPGATIKQQQVEAPIHMSPEQKKAFLQEWAKTQPGAQIPQIQERNWDDEDEKFLNGDKPLTPPKPPEPKVDPIQMMFKMFKSNYPVKLSVEIEENIPNPTFIGMVQENVEADAVEYYANLISDKILKDPSKLKTEIYNQLKSIINKELGIEEKNNEIINE
jgi:hypothetical protein